MTIIRNISKNPCKRNHPNKKHTRNKQHQNKKKNQFINLFKHIINTLFYNSTNNYTENKTILKLTQTPQKETLTKAIIQKQKKTTQ